VGVEASPFATVLAVLAARPSAALCRAAASCLAAFASADAACAVALVHLGVLSQLLSQPEGDGAAAACKAAANSLCAAHGPAQLWNNGVVPPEVAVGDGFYAVGADAAFCDLDEQRREATSSPASAAHAARASETLLVDSTTDPGLAQCLAAARTELGAIGAEVTPQAAAAAVARIVAAWQGGAVPYVAYEHYDNAAELGDLRHASGCRVVPLGALRRGRARQRALLFKALADAVGLPASYHMGACTRGAHKQHAWNTVVAEGQVLVVDVLHEPGQLYPEEADAARQYKRIDEFAFSSLAASRHAFTTSSATPAPHPEARRVAA